MISIVDIGGDMLAKKSLELLTESMFYVLMSFSKGEMCGIEIVKFIQEKTKCRIIIGPWTLYTILAKFEGERLIKETKVEGRKRTYKVTEKGIEVYKNEVIRLKQCVQDGESEVF